MNNVASISDPVKVTAEQAIAFAEDMGKRGKYNPTSARLFETALRQFLAIMADDEPKTARAVLDNLDDLCDRWARLNNADPATARQYKVRAKNLLTDFIEFMADPTSFKGRGQGPGVGGNRKSGATSGRKSQTGAAERIPDGDASANLNAGQQSSNRAMRTYPLDDNREIEYRLPVGGIKWTEVAKFALHLLTLAKDFDPAVPEQNALFAIVRRNPE
jgi:hypothetical protein